MPIVDDPSLKKSTATEPADPDKPPRYGQITSLVKDVFVVELRKFLRTDNKARVGEIANVDKYAVAADISDDPFATATDLVRAYPEIVENLPIVAILSTSGKNNKLSVSDKFVGNVQWPPKVVAATAGPYDLSGGGYLDISSTPFDGRTEVVTRLVFDPRFMKNISAASPEDVVNGLRGQALYVTPGVSGGKFCISAGGQFAPTHPNMVKVIGGADGVLAAFGVSVGDNQKSTDVGQVMLNRYYMSASLTVSIEIATESEHQRTELTDLIFDFFTFVMADRQFTFYGRSTFDDTIPDETYQIIIQDADISISGEQEMQRSSDQSDKIYVNRINVPVHAIQYVDRILTDASGTPLRPFLSVDTEFDETLNMPN